MTDAAVTPEDRLLQLFEGRTLSPTHRRIGQYLLRNARESIFLSSVDLAKRAGVSQPSVTRFATALGFSGYQAMQHGLRELVGALPPAPASDSTKNKYQEAVEIEQDNLQQLKAALADKETVTELGAKLADASGILVVGLRASSYLATYFGYLCAKIHPNVRVISEAGSANMDRILYARRDGIDTVLCFSLPRYPRELRTALEYARKQRMNIITVTDTPLSPLGELSDTVLVAPVSERLLFDSHAAALLLATILLETMSDVDPAATQELLDEDEQALSERDTFL